MLDELVPEKQVDLGMKPKRLPEKFLRGPVPWLWLCSAAALPGKSLEVAIAISHLAGLHRSSTFQMQPARLREMGVSPSSASRAIADLETARLISVERSAGAAPIVTVVWTARGAATAATQRT